MSENSLGEIISNEPLALDILVSVETAISDFGTYLAGSTFKEVLQNALDASIRDIKEHPNGKLFQRFIEYGPQDENPIPESTTKSEKELTDAECEKCIEFIHSHMVNRFKGELAELLSIKPCLHLINQLKDLGTLPDDTLLYFGDTIQERRQVRGKWAGFTKGADGLIVRVCDPVNNSGERKLELYGIIEVKSMYRSKRKLDAQIKKHEIRLGGGVKLEENEWSPNNIVDLINLRISVIPANWKLDRNVQFEKTETGQAMVFPERTRPQAPTQMKESPSGRWTITLSWSQEALEEAAYEMTFWYMSQVGRSVFTKASLPSSWAEMTQEDAGRNSLKMMLYYILLRPLSDRHLRLAAKLYNVYCFGYPVGIDSREMLWPDDLK